MNDQYRRIFKTQATGAVTIQELLQSMFVAEMLISTGELWIVSPSISNVVLIDNRSGNFDALNPEWGRREVRLVDVLVALMVRGAVVRIVTRDDEINHPFISKLRDGALQLGLDDQYSITLREKLHNEGGVLLSNSLLMGSMNWTYKGMEINDERVEFSLDQEELARTKRDFEQYLRSSHAGHSNA
ncbi:phospholipase D-like domain-containing protein DpdK [Massilia sp. 2TAF26]|uniref:phospholipase D-like domain-containing protein DpdK n=1 Tax=Massilia sp. 2TAF26 TaxID=3233012 RepID=UPI003F9683BA